MRMEQLQQLCVDHELNNLLAAIECECIDELEEHVWDGAMVEADHVQDFISNDDQTDEHEKILDQVREMIGRLEA